MNELYKQRRQHYMEKMMKYLKYVFNDHFMIMIFFIMGGAGLYYSMLLKQLNPPVMWPLWLFVLLFAIVLSVGKVATLVEEADKVFLLPKEAAFAHYLRQSQWASIWIPILSLIAFTGVMMPLLVLTRRFTFQSFFILVIVLILLKIGELSMSLIRYYQYDKARICYIVYYIACIATIAIAMVVSLWLALLIAIILYGGAYVFSQRVMQHHILNWDVLIAKEEQRQLVIYRFINLFTDVPEIKVTVHRRQWCDALLHHIKPQQSQTFLYLYARHFIRSNEYSGLFIRLTLIGAVLLFCNTSFYVSAIIAIVFVYLLLFQLVPLYKQFNYHIMASLYPVPQAMKEKNIQSLLQWIALVMDVIFFIAMIVPLGFIASLFIFIIILIETYLFTHLLLKRQLKKYE